MEKVIFILLMFFCSCAAYAQNRSAGSSTAIRMLLTSDDVLYARSGNPFQVLFNGKNKMDLEIKIDNGFITRGDTCWFAQVDTGKAAEIKVFVKSGEKLLKACSKKFPVRLISTPEPAICGISSEGTISKDELLKNPKLEIKIDGLKPGKVQMFSVSSFSMDIMAKGVVSTITAKGSGDFSAEQIGLIKKANPGTKIFFEDIKVAGYDGTQRVMSTIVLKLK